MLKSIRYKLILLYTCSTGCILTAIIVFAMIVMEQQMLRSKLDAFQNCYLTINQNIETSNEVSNLWMAEMETKNKLIIHIEENSIPFLYQGAWKAPTDRLILINKVKELAEKDNVYANLRPISTSRMQSKVYQIKGNHGDRYLGELFVLATPNGFRSAVVLQDNTDKNRKVLEQRLFFLLMNLLGITALFLVSRWVVGKSLKPVEESRKRQTEFIAAASHELKSPLAVIRANASAIIIEKERAEHFISGIDKECKRLSDLIEDMLLLASADAKSWHMMKEVIDMDRLLIETYDTFYPFCKENGKELRLLLPEALLPNIEGDTLRVKQILAALIDNAVTYSKEEDTIILRAYVKKNYLNIEVEDHGPGIEQENKNEIFERFYREDMSRKDKKHYGLGLSIAKELVDLQEGDIAVKDTQGGGATFIISFPILKADGQIMKISK